MDLKGRYARFREWQKRPFCYEYKSHEVQHCMNCNHDFTGNFCPYCSQKAGMGAVTWSSVRQGVMEIWGVGNRSMAYSVWQLLWRPGYFVGDYISGRRQVSFPPVKMLLILAVIVTLVSHLFGVDDEPVTVPTDRDYDIVAMIAEWCRNNMGWGMLVLTSMLIIPTWLLFRFSPHNTRHTLPAGFFLQVFMSVIIMTLSFFMVFLGDWLTLLIPVCFFVAYRQLFGYGNWATLWRLLLIWLSGIELIVILALTVETVVRDVLIMNQPLDTKKFTTTIVVLLMLQLPLAVACFISWWRYRRRTLLTIKSIDYVRKDETTPRPDSERDS